MKNASSEIRVQCSCAIFSRPIVRVRLEGVATYVHTPRRAHTHTALPPPSAAWHPAHATLDDGVGEVLEAPPAPTLHLPVLSFTLGSVDAQLFARVARRRPVVPQSPFAVTSPPFSSPVSVIALGEVPARPFPAVELSAQTASRALCAPQRARRHLRATTPPLLGPVS